MKKFLNGIAFFLLWISLPCNGQTDFRPGYYISNDYDTIYGQIDYRGDLRNTTSCVYRSRDKAKSVRFSPSDIVAYKFIQGKYFISKQVSISDGNQLVFVEYLVNGIADLYYFRDKIGDHYLLETKDGDLVELVNKDQEIVLEGRSYVTKGYQHVGLLKASFSDCNEIQLEIDDATLGHRSLINITEKYHDYVCDSEQCIVYQRELPALRINISPTLGLSVTKLVISNSSRYEKFDFQADIAPTIGLLINLEAPRMNDKLSLQFEADLLKNSFKSHYEDHRSTGNIYYYHANATTTSLRFMMALKYKYPKGRIRPTLALGPLFNYFMKTEFSYSQETLWNYTVFEDAPLTNLTIGLFVAAGMDFKLSEKYTAFCNLKFSRTSGWQKEITILQNATLNIGVYF